MKNTFVLVFGLLLATTNAYAVNKCTNADGSVSYQEAPCQRGAKTGSLDVPQMKPAKAPEGEELERKKSQCAEAVKHGVLWKDPDSVKLGSVIRVGSGQSLKPSLGTVIRYGVEVNAKNSYGGYTGKRMAFCEFDLSEKSIVNVHVVHD